MRFLYFISLQFFKLDDVWGHVVASLCCSATSTPNTQVDFTDRHLWTMWHLQSKILSQLLISETTRTCENFSWSFTQRKSSNIRINTIKTNQPVPDSIVPNSPAVAWHRKSFFPPLLLHQNALLLPNWELIFIRMAKALFESFPTFLKSELRRVQWSFTLSYSYFVRVKIANGSKANLLHQTTRHKSFHYFVSSFLNGSSVLSFTKVIKKPGADQNAPGLCHRARQPHWDRRSCTRVPQLSHQDPLHQAVVWWDINLWLLRKRLT